MMKMMSLKKEIEDTCFLLNEKKRSNNDISAEIAATQKQISRRELRSPPLSVTLLRRATTATLSAKKSTLPVTNSLNLKKSARSRISVHSCSQVFLNYRSILNTFLSPIINLSCATFVFSSVVVILEPRIKNN